MRLQDRVALVTGASRGIGRAIALALAKEGAHVAVNYRQDAVAATSIAQAIRDTGHRASTVRADTAKRSEVVAMVNNVVQEFGGDASISPQEVATTRVAFRERVSPVA